MNPSIYVYDDKEIDIKNKVLYKTASKIIFWNNNCLLQEKI